MKSKSLPFYIAVVLLYIMIANIKCKSTKPPSPALLYNTPDSLIHKWECPSAGLKLNKPPGTTYTPTIAYETIGRVVLDTPRRGIKVYSNRPSGGMMVMRYRELVIGDSLGEVANRDSLGNWEILDCKRALEACYKAMYQQYKKINQ